MASSESSKASPFSAEETSSDYSSFVTSEEPPDDLHSFGRATVSIPTRSWTGELERLQSLRTSSTPKFVRLTCSPPLRLTPHSLSSELLLAKGEETAEDTEVQCKNALSGESS